MLFSLFRRFLTRPRRASANRQKLRLCVEPLEDRLTPTTTLIGYVGVTVGPIAPPASPVIDLHPIPSTPVTGGIYATNPFTPGYQVPIVLQPPGQAKPTAPDVTEADVITVSGTAKQLAQQTKVVSRILAELEDGNALKWLTKLERFVEPVLKSIEDAGQNLARRLTKVGKISLANDLLHATALGGFQEMKERSRLLGKMLDQFGEKSAADEVRSLWILEPSNFQKFQSGLTDILSRPNLREVVEKAKLGRFIDPLQSDLAWLNYASATCQLLGDLVTARQNDANTLAAAFDRFVGYQATHWGEIPSSVGDSPYLPIVGTVPGGVMGGRDGHLVARVAYEQTGSLQARATAVKNYVAIVKGLENVAKVFAGLKYLPTVQPGMILVAGDPFTLVDPSVLALGTVNYQGHTLSDNALRMKLQEIANVFLWTINVTDGDRGKNPGYGSATSLHKTHHAVDFHVKGLSDKEVFNLLLASGLLSTGYEVILHGQYHGKEVTGPHVHVGRYVDERAQQPSEFKLDGVHSRGEKYVLVNSPVP